MRQPHDVDAGFVGLGVMGSRMVARLADAGNRVAVYDTNPAAIAALHGDRVVECESPRHVADLAATVLVSLPTPQAAFDVVCGESGLLEGSAFATYVDLSTTGTKMAGTIADRLANAGVAYVDAPVSGGAIGALKGTLTVMVAGSEAALDVALPLLRNIGSNVVVVGDQPGQAQVMKVANNLLSATAMVATAEVLALGARAGLDPATMIEVLNTSSGKNTATSDKFPKFVLPGNFDSGFKLALMAKDVRLCMEEAAQREVPMTVGPCVATMYSEAARAMPPESDATRVVTFVEQVAKSDVARPAASASLSKGSK